MRYNVIIWGIGGIYNKHVNTLKYLEYKEQIEIVAITAKEYSFLDKIDGYPVINKNQIKNLLFDYLIIMSEKGKEQIQQEALGLGIPREKILPHKILDIPNFVFCKYIKLKDSKISIISNNCWGGIVYETLGLECISPFKNLFVIENEYLKLLHNLEYYLESSLELSRFAIDDDGKKKYPIMRLRDVDVHCNHDMESEKAQENWNRRCKKINYNNLFVAMYTKSRKLAEEFLNIKYEKKVCFVPFESKSDDLISLREVDSQKEFWECVNSNGGIGNGSYSYNLIDLLLNEKMFSRCEKA